MRISDWSSDVCSSDLPTGLCPCRSARGRRRSACGVRGSCLCPHVAAVDLEACAGQLVTKGALPILAGAAGGDVAAPAIVEGEACAFQASAKPLVGDRKSTRLNSSH